MAIAGLFSNSNASENKVKNVIQREVHIHDCKAYILSPTFILIHKLGILYSKIKGKIMNKHQHDSVTFEEMETEQLWHISTHEYPYKHQHDDISKR